MALAITKSDVTLIEEFCMKMGPKPRPVYTFLHKRQDACKKVCSVQCFEITIKSHDNSKKKAKLRAAKNLINYVCCLYRDAHPISSSQYHLIKGTLRETKEVTNFVGKLYECAKAGTLPPKFEMIHQFPDSPRYNRIHVKCTFNGVEMMGTGSTEKQARQTVAKMMLKTLPPKQLPANCRHPINIREFLDFCSKYQLNSPSYEIISTDPGTDICVKCSVNDVEKLGFGSTKEDARREAGITVFTTLRVGDTIGSEFFAHSNEPSVLLNKKTECNESMNDTQVEENESDEMSEMSEECD